MRRVTVRGCRMTGLLWTEGALRDVTLSDCAIDLASFAAATVEHVVFERCILRQTDFQDADLRLVSFVDCDLTDADLSGARLAHCELRGCTLDGLRGAASLRGAAMPWADIVAAAGTFADASACACSTRIRDEQHHRGRGGPPALASGANWSGLTRKPGVIRAVGRIPRRKRLAATARGAVRLTLPR